MTLILETGVGVPNANSYRTDAQALAYLTDRGLAAQWTAIGAASDREAKLVQAGDFLNGLSWKSIPLDDDQTMSFPRLAYDGVPARVGQAQILLALQAASGPLTPTVADPAVTKLREKLDGVGETETEYAEPTGGAPTYLFLAGLIGDLLETVPGAEIQVARRYA